MKPYWCIPTFICLVFANQAAAQSAAWGIYSDMIKRNEERLERNAQIRQQNAQILAQQQAAEAARASAELARRRSNAYLPDESRCLQGVWELRGTNGQSGEPVNIDIRLNGVFYQNGTDMLAQQGVTYQFTGNTLNVYMNGQEGSSSFNGRETFSLRDNELRGTIRLTQTKKKFFGGEDSNTVTHNLVGSRLGDAPPGCGTQQTRSKRPEDQSRGESLVDSLNNLNELHQQGILTEQEFNAAKRRLLGL